MPDIQTHKSYCSFCHANCAVEIDVADGQVTAVRGDRDNPVFEGFTCLKGRELGTRLTHDSRLTSSLKRTPSGDFEEIDTATALREIGDRMVDIHTGHGARAIASYAGNYSFQNAASVATIMGFHQALGSPSYFTAVTVDQPAKVFMGSRFGEWEGGPQTFRDADVLMVLGGNPLVSAFAPPGGVTPFNSSRQLRDKLNAGMGLIVVDPRLTETARLATIHLQIRPGEDAALLAAMINVVISETLYDSDFVSSHVAGFDQLQAAVKPFTPQLAADRCGVDADQIIAAARLFAAGPKGAATSGTGPEMAGGGVLTDHLIRCLNALCGRYIRQGEEATVPKPLTAPVPRRAQVSVAGPVWGEGFTASRTEGITALGFEMPCAVMADEILTPGPEQIRALICVGGNPVVAFPEQQKVAKAMASLDLLVCADAYMSATARLADYIIAPKMCLERSDMTNLSEWWYEDPYAHYVDPIVDAPDGCINEWEIYWELARRFQLSIPLPGGALTTNRKPSEFEVLEKVAGPSPVAIKQVRAETGSAGGKVFEHARRVVEPADPASAGKFQLGLSDMMEALDHECRDSGVMARTSHRFMAISRRLKHVYNSSGHRLPNLRKHGSTNHAFMNPDDMIAEGLDDLMMIEVRSDHGTVQALVKADNTLREGVISIAHGFGHAESDVNSAADEGQGTNRLTSSKNDLDPITAMPRQSAIPVSISMI